MESGSLNVAEVAQLTVEENAELTEQQKRNMEARQTSVNKWFMPFKKIQNPVM
jgi:hypothetical protein